MQRLCLGKLAANDARSPEEAGGHEAEAAGFRDRAVGGRILRRAEVEAARSRAYVAVEADLCYVTTDVGTKAQEEASRDIPQGEVGEGEGEALAGRYLAKDDGDGGAGFGDVEGADPTDVGVGCGEGFKTGAEEIGVEVGIVEDLAVENGSTGNGLCSAA